MTLAIQRPPKQWRRSVGISRSNLGPAGLRRERQFEHARAASGHPVVRSPRRFDFLASWYVPDFYSVEEDTYYEVIGSRQRAAQLAVKLDLMTVFYPNVRLQVVHPDGRPYTTNKMTRHYYRLDFAAALHATLAHHHLVLADLPAVLRVSTSLVYEILAGTASPGPTQTLYEWVRDNAPPGHVVPVLTFPSRRARQAETRVLAAATLARIRDGGIVCAAIARGLGVTPQEINGALHRRGLPLLRRIAAWLDGPGANGAGLVDLRRGRTETRA